jgi:H+/Cl- antiporter ClcA
MRVPTRTGARAGSAAALLGVSVASGVVAAVVGAAFIFVVEEGTRVVWESLPQSVGVDPFGSWWLFVVPVVGGVLVGLGQRLLGDFPQSIEHTVAQWRAGTPIDRRTGPASAVNSAAALISGGPLGFEAALTGVLGGAAAWLSRHIRSAGHLVREAWGAERIDRLPRRARHLPYWLTALAGLLTYRSLPFGHLDLGFRLAPDRLWTSPGEAVAVGALAAVVVVPGAWVVHVVRRAEASTLHRRAPELAGVVGSLLFATLALGDSFVLFSGQQAIEHLVGLDTASLLYLAVAKCVALAVALVAGWRGGPFFPLFLSVSAVAVAVHGPLGTPPELMMAGGIAAVCVVVSRGRIPMAFVLSLYVVPLSYTGPLLVAAAVGAGVLVLAGVAGLVPPQERRPGTEG